MDVLVLILPLVVLAALIWWVWRLFRPGPRVVCQRCGQMGRARRVARGNHGIELLLYLLFIIPGMIYSSWRASTVAHACRMCGSRDVLPAKSPLGQVIQKQLSEQLGGD